MIDQLIALCFDESYIKAYKKLYSKTEPIVVKQENQTYNLKRNTFESIVGSLPAISDEPNYQFERIVNSFKQLKEGWAGEGSIPTDPSIVLRSKEYFKKLSDALNLNFKIRMPDSIVPTPYGTIVIDWERGVKLLSIEIGEFESSFFTKNIDEFSLLSDLPIESLTEYSKNILENHIFI
jgi:hypothetical protein